jgi:hypothetical protein
MVSLVKMKKSTKESGIESKSWLHFQCFDGSLTKTRLHIVRASSSVIDKVAEAGFGRGLNLASMVPSVSSLSSACPLSLTLNLEVPVGTLISL